MTSVVKDNPLFDGMELDRTVFRLTHTDGLSGCFKNELEVFASPESMNKIILSSTYTDLDGEVYGLTNTFEDEYVEKDTMALNLSEAKKMYDFLGHAIAFMESQEE